MSVPYPIPNPPPNVNNDVNNIEADIEKRAEAVAQQVADKENLLNVVLPKLGSIKDAGLAMAYVAYVFETLGQGGSILGVLDDGIGVLGGNLSISGDLNLVQSDYQNFMNQQMQESYNPNSPNPDTEGVKTFVKILDDLISYFAQDTKSNPDGKGTSILGIDPTEVSNIESNLCEIRKQIHVTFDDGSVDNVLDPTSNADPTKWVTFDSETNKSSANYSTVYIDTDAGSGKIQGFNQLNWNAQQQGDKSNAANVIKTTDNDNNTVKTSLGSVSQVVNSNLSHATNVEKEIMGVYDNILHSVFKAMDAAVSNQKSQ